MAPRVWLLRSVNQVRVLELASEGRSAPATNTLLCEEQAFVSPARKR